jgi:hypothetical protein
MLTSFLIAASVGAGFAQAPWWFWLVGGSALAFLSLTDPFKLRPVYAVLGDAGTLAVHGMVSLVTGCLASAVAFGAGRALWWALAA